jgi:hypothetical protein
MHAARSANRPGCDRNTSVAALKIHEFRQEWESFSLVAFALLDWTE